MSPSCKLCHGPLTSVPTTNQIECHVNCLPFACPGCVKSNKSSFTILNLKNHIYDYQCSECMIENENKSKQISNSILKVQNQIRDDHVIC
ncbi:uncharacterized protein I206_105538 [Kwoniella pini CBS 10737]|uniref:Uncharacterized protein n=1 Tax=Kwoniella pini CBS 10737 TaxID=1296096 RepID=A0A1B9I436_9TREE|nr:uncharacterized protein I206_03560 [Kwoniella pini CBS 10737]OCF50241.1 hypothetical protein I206_03560 [Kwoniella pini CBS 10737]